MSEIEYECMTIGCDFVGSREQCERHEFEVDGHDHFGEWPDIAPDGSLVWRSLAAPLPEGTQP